MSSTYAQFGSETDTVLLLSSSDSVNTTRRAWAKCNWRLACTFKEARDWPAASRRVRPSCWLHFFFSCPLVGEDSSQHRAPSSRSFDGVTPSHSAKLVLHVTRNQYFCWFSHFRADFPRNLRGSWKIPNWYDPAALRTCEMWARSIENVTKLRSISLNAIGLASPLSPPITLACDQGSVNAGSSLLPTPAPIV